MKNNDSKSVIGSTWEMWAALNRNPRCNLALAAVSMIFVLLIGIGQATHGISIFSCITALVLLAVSITHTYLFVENLLAEIKSAISDTSEAS